MRTYTLDFYIRAAFERELSGYVTAWSVGEEARGEVRERCHFRGGGDGGVGFGGFDGMSGCRVR